MTSGRLPGLSAHWTRLAMLLGIVCCVAAFLTVPGAPVVAAKQEQRAHSAPNLTSKHDGYVGSAKCAACHKGIYTSYKQTKMGRSMEAVTTQLMAGMSLPATVYSAQLDRHFNVYSKDGKLYQSEWQGDSSGKEIFRDTHEMEWTIGAGTNGYGTLLRRGNFIFEAPLSYYTRAAKWELSPGYETHDIGFARPIQADCINCHSGRPEPLDATSGAFAAQPFEQLAIGCENCHGPGAAHIAAMHDHSKKDAGRSIANPDDMSAHLVNDLCMSCHEGGDSRVAQPGKTYADFRPGAPLNETLEIFMAPMRKEAPQDSEHVQHYLQMSMSKCFRASGGKMSCTTCHDPHVEPTHEQAPAYFNAKCQVCHSASSHPCTASLALRRATAPMDDCISCHMPRRVAAESAHTTLANHRILATPDEPWPDEAFQMTIPPLTDLVHLDRPSKGKDMLPAVTLLAAYDQMMQSRPEYRQTYLLILELAERQSPDDPYVQRSLGLRDILNQSPGTAIDHLQRAIALNPKDATSFAYLSEAFRRQKRPEETTAAIETAVELDPYNQPMQRTLVASLLAQKRLKEAEAAAQHYIETFPQDRRMPAVLDQIRASK